MTSTVLISDILLATQKVTRVGIRDLKGDGRFPHIQEARNLAYFVACERFYKSCPDVARVMGRDRTSVADMVKKLRAKGPDAKLVAHIEAEAWAIATARLMGKINYSGYPIYQTQTQGVGAQ